MITKDTLLQIVPNAKYSKLNLDQLCANLSSAFYKNNFDTVNRQAAFLSECAYESGSFCIVVENLNYSAQRLTAIFEEYFPTIEEAEAYARQPEKIGNFVYGNRMGNGPPSSGDGFKFRGRGFIQLTGKENYTRCGKALGKDLISNPDYLTTIEGALESAIWYWNTNKLNTFADKDEIDIISEKVNGGLIGHQDRALLYEKAKKVLGTK